MNEQRAGSAAKSGPAIQAAIWTAIGLAVVGGNRGVVMGVVVVIVGIRLVVGVMVVVRVVVVAVTDVG